MKTKPRKIDVFARHVELLRPLTEARVPYEFSAQNTPIEQRLLLREMKECGFIDCVYRCDHRGIPSDFINVLITDKGRNLVSEYDFVPEPEQKKTNWAMVSALIALAVYATYAMWKLAQLPSPW